MEIQAGLIPILDHFSEAAKAPKHYLRLFQNREDGVIYGKEANGRTGLVLIPNINLIGISEGSSSEILYVNGHEGHIFTLENNAIYVIQYFIAAGYLSGDQGSFGDSAIGGVDGAVILKNINGVVSAVGPLSPFSIQGEATMNALNIVATPSIDTLNKAFIITVQANNANATTRIKYSATDISIAILKLEEEQ